MGLREFKDLSRRTKSDKILRDKAFNIAKNLDYYGYQRGLTSMICNFFDKKFVSLADKFASVSGVKSQIMSNQQLAEELLKATLQSTLIL